MPSIDELQTERLVAEIEKIRAETRRIIGEENRTLPPIDLQQTQKEALEVRLLELDINKTRAEIRNLNRLNKSETTRFWAGLMVPAISALAVVGTLFFQIYVNWSEKEAKRKGDEDEQWRTFLAKINDSTAHMNDAVIVRSFFHSEKYRAEAIDLAANVFLRRAPDAKYFSLLYKDFYQFIDSSNYGNLVNLTYYLSRQIGLARIRNVSLLTTGSMDDTLTFVGEKMKELAIIGRGLALVISKFSKKEMILGLDDAYFFNINMKNIDFGKARLKGVILDSCDVSGCDLFKAVIPDGSRWNATAWWRAKQINDPLLVYLCEHYPYKKNLVYYNADIDSPISHKSDSTEYAEYYSQYRNWLKTEEELKERIKDL